MLKKRVIIGFALSLTIAMLSGCASNTASSWSLIQNSDISQSSYMAGYINETDGITVGYGGKIFYTHDGGQSWSAADNKSACRYCLDIINEKIAWSGGNGSHVRLSRDNGETWEEVTDPLNLTGTHSGISFVDDKTGWVSTTLKVAKTDDGGMSWADVLLPTEDIHISAIELRTADSGYILSAEGTLYITNDGGSTWSSQDIGLSKILNIDSAENKPRLNMTKSAVADISFSDENKGTIAFMCKVNNIQKVWVLETNDGGVNWASTEITTPEEFKPLYLYLSGDSNLLTVGNSKKVILYKKD